jgi:hypothetical protein
MSEPLDEAVVEATKHYAHSPIGLVAVLSDEVGGLVYVAKWIKASKLGPPFQLVEVEDLWRWEMNEQPNEDYERGFVDGMLEQAKRSVDRAVNRMTDALAQPERTLTDEVIADLWHQNGGFHHHFARAVERYLKGEK